MRWMKWAAGLAVVGMLGSAACEPAGEQPPETEPPAAAPMDTPAGAAPEGATQEQVAQGRQLFAGQANCFTCHGPDATGTQLAPNLTDDEWLWIDPAQGDTLTQVATLIQTGVAQPRQYPAAMPPMGGAQLSDEQIRALAAYVVSVSGSGQ